MFVAQRADCSRSEGAVNIMYNGHAGWRAGSTAGYGPKNTNIKTRLLSVDPALERNATGKG